MNFFLKNAVVILFVVNICAQYIPLAKIADPLFIGLIVIGIIPLVNLFKNWKGLLKRMPIIATFISIYILYELIFGLLNPTSRSVQMFFSKLIVLAIVYCSATSGFNFFKSKFPVYAAYTIAGLLLYGALFHSVDFLGRYTFGFGNPNTTGAISVMGFAMGVFSINKRNRRFMIPAIGMCCISILFCGSRASIAMVVIVILFRFKLSVKLIISVIVAISGLSYITPKFGYSEISGLTRMSETLEAGDFIDSRKYGRELTMRMIYAKPITGWGYGSMVYNFDPDADIGAENGYIDMAKDIGVPFTVLLYLIMAYYLYRLRVLLNCRDHEIKLWLAIVAAVLFGAMYESYIVGVNQIITNIFFLAIAICEYTYYMRRRSMMLNNPM